MNIKQLSPFFRKMLSNGIINKFMLGTIYKIGRSIHIKRLKTLKELEKQM